MAGVNPDPEKAAVGVLANMPTHWAVGLVVAVVALVLIAWAVMKSKRDSPEMEEAYRETQ